MSLAGRNQNRAAQEQGADLVFASYLGTKFLTLTYEPKNGVGPGTVVLPSSPSAPSVALQGSD